ncbi:hypothetical protein QUA42_16810 [Microcoleus sp. Pol11C2]
MRSLLITCDRYSPWEKIFNLKSRNRSPFEKPCQPVVLDDT